MNREDVAMDLTVQNVEILRRRLEHAEAHVSALIANIERNTCTHEETHHGGAIWEICDSCGAKWADDEGGRPEFVWPKEVESARQFLASQQVEIVPGHGEHLLPSWRNGQIQGEPHVLDFCPPKHPEQAEGAQGEREAFDAAYARGDFYMEEQRSEIQYQDYRRHQAFVAFRMGWRAALAQPSPVPKSDMQRAIESWEELSLGAHLYRCCVGIWNNLLPDEEAMPEYRELRKAMDDWENGKPSPAPELERPEVMAVLVLGGVFDGRELGDNDIVTVNPAIERLQAALVTDGEVLVELMTVAQHDRIAGALRAEVERNKRTIAGMNEAHAKLAGLYEAAQARVAELEKQEPVAVVKGDGSLGAGFPPGTKLYANPVAQAGQVPEGWKLVPLVPTLEMKNAGWRDIDRQHGDPEELEMQPIYEAMIAAAPAQGGEA